MQTPASIYKHPVHPMLVALPAGLWVFSLFYAVNIWLRLGDPNLALAIALSVIGVGMLAVSSWLETQLARVHG